MANQRGQHPSRYAILIGIDAYHDNPLQGCIADVQEISNILGRSVDDVRTYTFTATPNPERGPSQPACLEREESRPTYENISSCLEQITEKAQPGSHVYIHYSGHSTVTPPDEHDPYSNTDKGDLALAVLHGPSASEIRYLYGGELAMSLKHMVEKGATVTMVLDCCYAGSTMRNDDAVRFIEYDPEIEEKYPPRQWPAEGSQRPEESRRQVSMTSNWMVPPDGYAILAAGDGTEKAYHVKFQDALTPRHGALTWFLLDSFNIFGGMGGTMYELCESAGARIREYNRRKSRKIQSPVLFGNRKQLFFGCSRPGGCAGDIAVTRYPTPGGGAAFRLHAGRAHDVSVADRFELWPLGNRNHTSPVVAEVTDIRGITSDLKVVQGCSSSVETGWLAAAQTHHSLRKFSISFLGFPSDSLAEWWRATQKWGLVVEDDTDEAEGLGEKPVFSYSIIHRDDASYEISASPSGGAEARWTATEEADRDWVMHQVLRRVKHLALFKLARELTNTGDDQLLVPFTAHIVKKRVGSEDTLFDPGCWQTKAAFASCYHPDCVVIATTDDIVKLRVTNETTWPNGVSLFLYVYALGSDGEIDECLKASREVIPAQGSGSDRGHVAPGVFEKKLRLSLEEGQASCEDVLKVFLTIQPTSFATWILPKIGAAAGPWVAKKSPLEEKRGGSMSDEWAVLTFRIRTHSKAVHEDEFRSKCGS
jgi:hypothetical protein